MTIIKSGDSGDVAKVTSAKRLKTDSVSRSSLEIATKENENAYSWYSTYAATANDEIISIKNTSSSLKLIIDEIFISSSANSVFTAFKVTTGTPTGTTLTPLNLSFSAGGSAPAESFGNAAVGGTLSGSNVGAIGVAANTSEVLDTQGAVMLSEDDIISITTSATATVYCTVIGHFIELE